VLSDNVPTVFEVYWAALRSGLYITAVNTHLTPSEVAYIVDDCGARVLVVSANMGGGHHATAAALTEEVSRRWPGSQTLQVDALDLMTINK